MSPSAAFADREGFIAAKGETNAEAATTLLMMADLSFLSLIMLSLFFQKICL